MSNMNLGLNCYVLPEMVEPGFDHLNDHSCYDLVRETVNRRIIQSHYQPFVLCITSTQNPSIVCGSGSTTTFKSATNIICVSLELYSHVQHTMYQL